MNAHKKLAEVREALSRLAESWSEDARRETLAAERACAAVSSRTALLATHAATLRSLVAAIPEPPDATAVATEMQEALDSIFATAGPREREARDGWMRWMQTLFEHQQLMPNDLLRLVATQYVLLIDLAQRRACDCEECARTVELFERAAPFMRATKVASTNAKGGAA